MLLSVAYAKAVCTLFRRSPDAGVGVPTSRTLWNNGPTPLPLKHHTIWVGDSASHLPKELLHTEAPNTEADIRSSARSLRDRGAAPACPRSEEELCVPDGTCKRRGGRAPRSSKRMLEPVGADAHKGGGMNSGGRNVAG